MKRNKAFDVYISLIAAGAALTATACGSTGDAPIGGENTPYESTLVERGEGAVDERSSAEAPPPPPRPPDVTKALLVDRSFFPATSGSRGC